MSSANIRVIVQEVIAEFAVAVSSGVRIAASVPGVGAASAVVRLR